MAPVYRARRGAPTIQYLPKDADATVLAVGDMAKEAAGVVTPVSALTDNLAFLGVVNNGSAADSSNEVGVEMSDFDAEYEFPLNTATTITINDELQISGVQELTKGTTDAIAVATRAGTTVSTVFCKFKLPALAVGDSA